MSPSRLEVLRGPGGCRALAAPVLALVILLAGACASSPAGDGAPAASPTPEADLAEPAKIDEAAGSVTTTAPDPGSGSATTSTGATPPTAPVPASAGDDRTWDPVASSSDASGDLGLTPGPAWSDARAVLVETAGDDARITVTVGAAVPARLAAGEVAGIAIDLYPLHRLESDHQVFLDGGVDGWRAFLQGPEGFVAFPGSFTISGPHLVVEVPWSAIGRRAGNELAVQIDWSGPTSVKRASSDRAPDRGRLALD